VSVFCNKADDGLMMPLFHTWIILSEYLKSRLLCDFIKGAWGNWKIFEICRYIDIWSTRRRTVYL